MRTRMSGGVGGVTGAIPSPRPDSPIFIPMTDDEIITKAESLGFRFHKRKDSWVWSVVAPDEDSTTCEQGDLKGMKWLREKITYFLENDIGHPRRGRKPEFKQEHYPPLDVASCVCPAWAQS